MHHHHHTLTKLIEQRLRDDRDRARRDHLAAHGVGPIRTLLARCLLAWARRLEPTPATDTSATATLPGVQQRLVPEVHDGVEAVPVVARHAPR